MPGIFQAVEYLLGQQRVAQAAAEALDEGVLPRLKGLDLSESCGWTSNSELLISIST